MTTAPPITVTPSVELIDVIAERVAALIAPERRDDWPAWLDIEAVERYTSIPRSTIYKSAMPRHKPDGRLLFNRAEVDAYLRGG